MVYILLGTGFEEIEAVAPFDILRRGGVDVQYAGIGGKEIEGAHGVRIAADIAVEEITVADAEMIVVPGGLGGVESIEASPEALRAIVSVNAKGAEVAAICAGPRVLAGLGILAGKNAVCYPGMEDQMTGAKMTQRSSTVRDDNVTTGRGPGAAIDFGLRLLEVLRGKDAAEQVRKEMHYGK